MHATCDPLDGTLLIHDDRGPFLISHETHIALDQDLRYRTFPVYQGPTAQSFRIMIRGSWQLVYHLELRKQ